MKNRVMRITLLATSCVFVMLLWVGCGTNPPSAPFGSTVTMIDPPGDITIPPDTQVFIDVRAIVLDPEGFPINDVKVDWSLFFTNMNDLVFDTDGDGIADAQALQFVDPFACGQVDCALVDSSFYPSLGALVDSPFQQLTNNQGVARILILAFGDFPVDPTTLEISIGTDVDTAAFSVTNN